MYNVLVTCLLCCLTSFTYIALATVLAKLHFNLILLTYRFDFVCLCFRQFISRHQAVNGFAQ
jgi:hypothetical protein